MTLANLGIFTIGLFTLSKNTRSITNNIFALLSLTLIGWTTANYISVKSHHPDTIYIAIRTIFMFVVLQNSLFYFFSQVFPARRVKLGNFKNQLYIYFSLVVAVAGAAGLFFKGYTYVGDKFSLSVKPLIIFFVLHAVFSIVLALRNLFYRYNRARGALRNQLLYLIFASVLLLIMVPLTNFVLPLIFHINTFASISSLYTLVFTVIIAYAIIREKLFDIRLAVATSAAYILSLATLGVIYGSVVYSLSNLLFGPSRQNTSVLSQLITVAFVVVLAFLFQPIKDFFDRITNRVFYRDAYDTQTVLDEINSLLTQEISLNKITSTSLKIICDNLKISHSYFVVLNKSKLYRVSAYGAGANKEIDGSDLLVFSKNVVSLDGLSGGVNKEILEKYNLSLSLKLSTQDGTVGYLLLSDKQSGNMYTDQDLKLLRIIANELAIAVQNAQAFDEIQKFNVTLRQKIDEATRELRNANVKLKELDHTKDEFISMASHQLRTPLTAIKGYLSMVLEGDVGKVKKDQQEMIQQAYDSAQKMVYLIADLLNVSRLQTGKFVIENKPTDLSVVVEGEIRQLTDQARTRNIILAYDKPASFPILDLDETKIRQVVMNFLDNGLYYTPSGGTVTAELKASSGSVTFTVSDTGVGVPKSVQHHLFSKFYRADNARKMRPDGTGLGLYMAKKVVVAEGGAIIFKSTEGQGSTFGFTFPLK